MRCVSCDWPLTSQEMGKKSPLDRQEYLMCFPCLKKAGLLTHQELERMPLETSDPPIEQDSDFLPEEIDLDENQ